MSKRDNKRYNDKNRKTAPKRGGKNRRDYGAEYEPKKRASSGGRRRAATGSGRTGVRIKRELSADFGYADIEQNIGTDGLEVVAGRNPVTEVLNGDRDVERVFIADGAEGSVSKIVALAKEQGVIVDFVPKEKIDAMAPGVKHQGVVAKVSEYKYAEMEDIFARADASDEDAFIILLDEITDPHNLGAIIRTAECAGAHGIIIPKRRAASLTQTVALSAAGAIETMPVVQVTNLGRTIDELKEKGVSIIYISHRMEEIFELCDRVTVLRDGEYIGTKKISETDMGDLIRMMIGREIGERYPERESDVKQEVFSVKHLTCPGAFEDISFEVKAGEVLGVAGLMGAGRTEIMKAIFGAMPHVTGEICIDGKPVTIKSPRDAIKHGIGFITEDRKTEGLMLADTISKNISIANLNRISSKGVLSSPKEKTLVQKAIEELHIKCTGGTHVCNNLSGGNQQKVVFSKWIYTEPRILILDEPTRGVDIGAKKEIYNIINQLAAQGVAIIIVSSELPEVLGMSDRILVIHEGKATGCLINDNTTQEDVMVLATGGTQ